MSAEYGGWRPHQALAADNMAFFPAARFVTIEKTERYSQKPFDRRNHFPSGARIFALYAFPP
jgi:hypothetical protein